MTEFIMTVAISASGKSTWANAQEGYYVLDSDKIREELYGDANDQQNPNKVFNLMYKRAIEALSRDQSVIYCATNLAMKHRMHTLNQIRRAFPMVKCRAIVFNTPLTVCKEWNKMRERQVPEWLFERQIKSFQMPVYNEGWDNIEVITPAEYDVPNFSRNIWQAVKDFGSQDNPHHSLSLNDHLSECIKKVDVSTLEQSDRINTILAAGLHDIGKMTTRVYDDRNVAHYPSHANYGAYLAMNMTAPIETIQLVCYHMEPYNPQSAATWEKRLGEDLWNKIMILHDADKAAH